MSPTPNSQSTKATTEHPSTSPDKYYATVYFQCKDKLIPIKGEIDTGSSTTTVMEAIRAEYFLHIPIKPPTRVLRNFDETPVQGIRGSIRVTAFHADKTQHIQVYITSNDATPVLSRNLVHPFGLVLAAQSSESRRPEQVRRAVNKYTQLIAAMFPSLMSEKIGCFPEYDHYTQPTTHKMHSVPLARRDTVMDEIQELVKQDIWEPVD